MKTLNCTKLSCKEVELGFQNLLVVSNISFSENNRLECEVSTEGASSGYGTLYLLSIENPVRCNLFLPID